MNKKNWSIRKATISDVKALSECMKAAYTMYSARMENKPLPPMTVDYVEEIKSYPVWIAEPEKKVLVGGLILMAEETHMTIANVAVSPDFQSNGLGRGLMDFAEEQAKQQGYKELRLATHILLTENISLYNYLGWSEISRDDYRVYMKKVIA